MDRAYERRLLTSEEVVRMMERGVFRGDEHIELLHGELVVAMGQGPAHRALTVMIHRLIDGTLGAGYHVADHSPMLAGRYNLPEPDLAVVRGAPEDFLQRLPTGDDIALIVEVSVTSTRADRAKSAIYAAAGVPRYWQIDVRRRQVHACQGPDRERTEYAHSRVAEEGEVLELEGHEIQVMALLPPPHVVGQAASGQDDRVR